jgi:hypothetical protein
VVRDRKNRLRSGRRFEPTGWLRWVTVAFLALVAAGSAFVALGALSNLWSDYQDSSTSTYMVIGAPFAVLSVAAIVALGQLLRRRR